MKKVSKYVSFFAIVIFTGYIGFKKYAPHYLQLIGNHITSYYEAEKNSSNNQPQEEVHHKVDSEKNTRFEKIQEIKTIDSLLATFTKKEATVIMGTMDHCHFCKQAEPIFKSYPSQFPHIHFFTANGPKTNMGALVYKETNNTIAIRGYPAFLFIKDGKIQDHLLGTNIEKLESKLRSL